MSTSIWIGIIAIVTFSAFAGLYQIMLEHGAREKWLERIIKMDYQQGARPY